MTPIRINISGPDRGFGFIKDDSGVAAGSLKCGNAHPALVPFDWSPKTGNRSFLGKLASRFLTQGVHPFGTPPSRELNIFPSGAFTQHVRQMRPTRQED